MGDHLVDLGFVSFLLRHCFVCPILLGQVGIWQNGQIIPVKMVETTSQQRIVYKVTGHGHPVFSSLAACVTIEGPAKGKPCVFPFRFGGERHDNCTFLGSGNPDMVIAHNFICLLATSGLRENSGPNAVEPPISRPGVRLASTATATMFRARENTDSALSVAPLKLRRPCPLTVIMNHEALSDI